VVALGLALLARAAQLLGITAIPFYLIAGLAVGEGGLVHLDVSADFISIAAEIGVLLLLLTLGLEYTGDELRAGLRSGARPGLVDALANFTPGLGFGFLLGWEPVAAVLLGGVTWVSSSGVAAKILTDLDRLSNRETPAVLNVLVIEDLAMAAYLPLAAALVAGSTLGDTAATVAIAFAAVALILTLSLRWGRQLSRILATGSDESAAWPSRCRCRRPSAPSSSGWPCRARCRSGPAPSCSPCATSSPPPSSSSSATRSAPAPSAERSSPRWRWPWCARPPSSSPAGPPPPPSA
jgi:Kef-type K+ transport system membrane component KefB